MRERSWEEIQELICKDDDDKWDVIENVKNLKIDNAGKLVLANNNSQGPLKLLPHAFGQMCARLNIPVRYAKRIPTTLQAQCINYDLGKFGKYRSRPWLLRCKGNSVRACLSDTYSVIDNMPILEMVASICRSFEHRIKQFFMSDLGIWLKVLVTGLKVKDPSSPSKDLMLGLLVGNSEVGTRSVSISPFVCRQRCTNDLVIQNDKVIKIRHAHKNSTELHEKLSVGMRYALQSGDNYLDAFASAYHEKIERPAETIRKLAEKRGLLQEQTKEIITAYEVEPYPSKFGIINALTSTARRKKGDERIELEKLAGSLLCEPKQQLAA